MSDKSDVNLRQIQRCLSDTSLILNCLNKNQMQDLIKAAWYVDLENALGWYKTLINK